MKPWTDTEVVGKASWPRHPRRLGRLSLPLSSVRVVCKYMGGGFGSKAELSKHTLIAVLLARRTGRPVRSVLTREESFLGAGNRPPHVMTLKVGATKDGALRAIDLEGVGAVGAYRDQASGGFLAAQLYDCPNVRIRETEVFTHTGKARAMRAPGFPQCAWALEQAIDALAERVGIDPVALRLRNLPRSLQSTRVVPYSSMGLGQCLIEGARAFGWKEARERPRSSGPVLRGVGVAACLWPATGGPPATAILELLADGSVKLTTGVSDLGTGAKTVLAMTAAEELGISLDRIQVECADTATTPYAQVSGGSRTIKVTRFLAAHDSGRVMNRLTYENQVLGGVRMGIGFALTERRVLDRQTGRVLNANLRDYAVPTVRDVPADVACLPIDPHDTECNATGTKGLGEPATIPAAPAIANAVYHATGIRVTRAPITPMQMLERLAARS